MRSLLAFVLASSASCVLPPSSQGGGMGPTNPTASGNDPTAAASDPNVGPGPTAAAPGAAAAAPAPAGPVYVTIRSSCPNTVKIFFGDKPKFGSGTYSSIESNSVQSHSFRPGEQLWIVDDSENGLGSTAIGPDTHELEIQSSCTSIAAR